MRGCLRGVVAVCVLASPPAQAQDVPTTLPPVVAVGEGLPAGAPASLDHVDAGAVPARSALSVSEWLHRVPGVVARDRQNLGRTCR